MISALIIFSGTFSCTLKTSKSDGMYTAHAKATIDNTNEKAATANNALVLCCAGGCVFSGKNLPFSIAD